MGAVRVIVWQIVLSVFVAGVAMSVVAVTIPPDRAATIWPYAAVGVIAASFVVTRWAWSRRRT